MLKRLKQSSLFCFKAMHHKDTIADISLRATNESTLELMLQKVIDLWAVTEFRLVSHQQQGIMILAGADDILTQLEECQVTIGEFLIEIGRKYEFQNLSKFFTA